jgi:hypothetical protein
MLFGRAVEHEMDAVKGKNDQQINAARQRVLARWTDQKPKFRSPPAMKGKDVEQEFSVKGDAV